MDERTQTHLSPDHVVQYLAGKGAALAADYLGGRIDEAALLRDTEALKAALFAETLRAPGVNALLAAGRLLTIAMKRAAVTQSPGRRDRWRAVMSALVRLVRHESAELTRAMTPGASA